MRAVGGVTKECEEKSDEVTVCKWQVGTAGEVRMVGKANAWSETPRLVV